MSSVSPLKLKSHGYGSDISIINTISRKYKDENDKYRMCLTLVYKDNTTGRKYKEEIIDPIYQYYIVKPEFRVPYNRTYIPIDQADPYRTKFLSLEKDIADNLGLKDWYKQKVQEGNFRDLRQIQNHPDVFMSDNNIEDHYRFWFDICYQNTICQVTKAFFDIETDNAIIDGEFPEPGECPVNAITIVFQHKKEVHTFLLRNSKNPQIAQIEQEIMQTGTGELKQFVLDHVSKYNRNKDGSPFYFGLEEFTFNAYFYDEDKEIVLISDFFKLVNTYKPDFCLAWNQSFDIPYLIARIQVLGYEPEELICHQDFENKACYYFIDERSKNEFEERCDYFACSSYSVYLDQMIQFASRRKGQTKFPSYSLDVIGTLMANVHKLDYKEITTRIEELPYKDYKKFFFYNVCDTIVQYCIEYYTQDIEYVFGKAVMNNTRYSKIHRQTVYLSNRGQKELWNDSDQCCIKGNNVNLSNEKTPYPGAFVADPLQVNDYSRLKINGTPSNIFDNTVDSDYKSLYPSIMREFNIFPHTQIGFIDVQQKLIHNKQNRTHYEHYTIGGQYLEDLQSHQWLEFGTRWLGLPDFSTLCESIEYAFTHELQPYYDCFNRDTIGKYYFPIRVRTNSQGYYRPIAIDNTMGEKIKEDMKGWIEHVASTPNQSF